MTTLSRRAFLRINGQSHAFGRELGCSCHRCRHVSFQLEAPSGRLEAFDGWLDPLERANTSVSLLIGEPGGHRVDEHVLVDCGAGVPSSLVASGLEGLEDVVLLNTHHHPDHHLCLNPLLESLRRTAKRRGRDSVAVPYYATLKTWDYLRGRGGHDYELTKAALYRQVEPDSTFLIESESGVRVTALAVAHGSIKGAVVYQLEVFDKKVLLLFDIDGPDAARPLDGKTNREVFATNQDRITEPDIIVFDANTFAALGTGHGSFLSGLEIIEPLRGRDTRVLASHLSAHEDGPDQPGYGLTDADWERLAAEHGIEIARQGQILPL